VHETRQLNYTNFARSTLRSVLSQGASLMRVQNLDAHLFPSADVAAQEIFTCVLSRIDDPDAYEIVYVTSVSVNEFTVERGKENSPDLDWPEGSIIVHTITAGLVGDIVEEGPRDLEIIVTASSFGSAVVAAGILVSFDGALWQQANVTISPAFEEIFDEVYSPALKRWVFVGTDRVIFTTDFIVWTEASSVPVGSWRGVAWSESLDLFCAVRNNGTIDRVMTSPDGDVWTERVCPTSDTWQDVIWVEDFGLFVTGSGAFNTNILTSPNGIDWTLRTMPASHAIAKFAYKAPRLLFAASLSGYAHSADGIVWVTGEGYTITMKGVANSPSIFLAIGASSGTRVNTSSDGLEPWAIPGAPDFKFWQRVAYAPDADMFIGIHNEWSGGAGPLKVTTTVDEGVTWLRPTTPVGYDTYAFASIGVGRAPAFPPIIPTSDDPSFSSVQLLCDFSGSHQQEHFTDQSNAARIPFFQDNARIDATQSKFGVAGLRTDGGLIDHIRFDDSDDFNLGSGDFTMEGHMRHTALPSTSPWRGHAMMSHYLNTGNQRGWWCGFSDNDELEFGWTTNGITGKFLETDDAPTIAIDTWYHIAITRVATNLRMFLDGVELNPVGSAIGTDIIFNSNQTLRTSMINTSVGFTRNHRGWIANLRLTVGVARYTATFTPPSGKFPGT